jgi:hypothetical protein
MIKLNVKLYTELKNEADQQGDFHVEFYNNTLKISNEIDKLRSKGLIKIEKNKFNATGHGVVLEVKGKILKDVFTVV